MQIRISCDDCSAEDVKVADLMAKYGLEKNIIYYWPAMPKYCNERVGRRSLTEEQMQDIASRSEIGAHGVTHALLTRIPLDMAKREIFESREILQQKFDQPIESFAYPRGYTNPDIQKLVEAAGYQTARGVNIGYIYESENPYYQQTTVHVACPRKEYAGAPWVQYAFKLLEEARYTKGSVYHAWFHSWEITKYVSWDDFEMFLKELSREI